MVPVAAAGGSRVVVGSGGLRGVVPPRIVPVGHEVAVGCAGVVVGPGGLRGVVPPRMLPVGHEVAVDCPGVVVGPGGLRGVVPPHNEHERFWPGYDAVLPRVRRKGGG